VTAGVLTTESVHLLDPRPEENIQWGGDTLGAVSVSALPVSKCQLSAVSLHPSPDTPLPLPRPCDHLPASASPCAAEALTADFNHAVVTPNQLRWRPFAIPEDPVDWVRGLFTICGAGR
jgi:hypothetical protein